MTHKVQAGDTLNIPAPFWNRLIDLEHAEQARKLSRRRQTRVDFRDAGIVKIKNNSGALLPRFGVLGIDGPLITPAANAGQFRQRPAFAGSSPTIAGHAGKFAVALEPIKSGKIGRCIVSGVTHHFGSYSG